MKLISRLDAYGAGGDEFHKPRRGDCSLCTKPTILHPCWAHRREVLRDLILRKIDRALERLYWHY